MTEIFQVKTEQHNLTAPCNVNFTYVKMSLADPSCVKFQQRKKLANLKISAWHPHVQKFNLGKPASRTSSQVSDGSLGDKRLAPAETHFLEVVNSLAKHALLILAFTNWGDCQTLFPDNLVHSLSLLGMNNYLLVASDVKSKRYLDCRGFHVFFDPSLISTPSERQGFNSDLSSSYHFLALKRFDILYLALRAGKHILFTDTDVYFLRNPLSAFFSSVHDLQFLWDGPGPMRGKEKNGEIQSNAGFIFVRNTPRATSWWTAVRDEMHAESARRVIGRGKLNDQQIISHALEKEFLDAHNLRNLTWRLLPRLGFVNGWVVKNMFKDESGGCAHGVRRESWVAVHMDYNRGAKRKTVQFKRCALWSCEYCKLTKENASCIVQVLHNG